MDARIYRQVLPALFLFSLLISAPSAVGQVTANFVVRAPNRQMGQQVAELAEKYRRELALRWLGHELPDWSEKCPIQVRIAQHAGGETSFVFLPNRQGQSAPTQWQMKIFGPWERILDSVLPHEVTHTIFATHFGRPLPRWADEGACTTVEHDSERKKNHEMLIQFLQTRRGIPFNHMFAMKQYPSDILPLYAQGHSLARYLIMQRGHRHFVDYIGDGMQREQSESPPNAWSQATKEFYGYQDLSDLQVAWINWVSQGSPSQPRTDVASGEPVPDHAAPLGRSMPRSVADNRQQTPPPNNLNGSHEIASAMRDANQSLAASDRADQANFTLPSAMSQRLAASNNYYVRQMLQHDSNIRAQRHDQSDSMQQRHGDTRDLNRHQRNGSATNPKLQPGSIGQAKPISDVLTTRRDEQAVLTGFDSNPEHPKNARSESTVWR